MELRVIGVFVIMYAVVSDDVGDWAAVDCEQQREVSGNKFLDYLSFFYSSLFSP